MKEVFSTKNVAPKAKIQSFLSYVDISLGPVRVRPLLNDSVEANIEACKIGSLGLSSLTNSAWVASVGQNRETDSLLVRMKMTGTGHVRQHDQLARQSPGDLTVIDFGYDWDVEDAGEGQSLYINVPRERLEGSLGSARAFAALNIDGSMGSSSLAQAFFAQLVRVQHTLTQAGAERVSGIGIDLLVASIAERLAYQTPRPVQATAMVQRAKAYIETNLHDTTLDPPSLAVAMGVSLRRLQQVFYERGRHISDYIWSRRLERAAQQLADPGYVHLSIGAIAFGCGFVSQAHFSTRFREQTGMTPSDYRRQASYAKAELV